MIDIPNVAKMEISPEVMEFMDACGGNHVSLYKGWKDRPEMKNGITNLEEQLAYTIVEKNLPLAKRIAGRIRKLSAKWEDAALVEAVEGSNPGLDCLL